MNASPLAMGLLTNQGPQPWFPGQPVPYAIGLVELVEQEGLRLTTNVVGCPVDDVAIGQQVAVTFEHHDPIWVPVFEQVRG